MTRPFLLLAPIQGITDPIARDLITSLGGIDACVSVYARVSNQVLSAEALLRTCPELREGGKTPAG
ncbi:MAG: tRNA dihydrouridine(16) synthase DusC, partial [Myxococcota bacterium]